MRFPHFHFSSKENRLLGFGAEAPDNAPQQTPNTEVNNDQPLAPETTPEIGAQTVMRAKEVQDDAQDKVSHTQNRVSVLDIAVRESANLPRRIGTKPENSSIGESFKKAFKENPSKESPDSPNATAPEQTRVDPETAKLAKSFEGIGMTPENAQTLAAGLKAISELMKTLKTMFKDPNAEKAKKEKEAENDKDKNKERSSSGASSNAEQRNASPESAEKSVSEVQNPKQEAEKIGDVEAQEKDLEKQIDTASDDLANAMDGDTTADERTALINKISDLNEQLTKVEQKTERKSELLDEQSRRETLVSDKWKQAMEKSGANDADRIASRVELGGDGDDLVITINHGDPKEWEKMYKEAGLDATSDGKTVTIHNIPASLMGENSDMLDQILNPIASGVEKKKEDAPEKESEFPPAKDAPEGQIRQDTEGNHWKKGADRMWESVHDPDNNMTSDSGFKNTKWGDDLMDQRTAKIINEKEESAAPTEESAPPVEKPVETPNTESSTTEKPTPVEQSSDTGPVEAERPIDTPAEAKKPKIDSAPETVDRQAKTQELIEDLVEEVMITSSDTTAAQEKLAALNKYVDASNQSSNEGYITFLQGTGQKIESSYMGGTQYELSFDGTEFELKEVG